VPVELPPLRARGSDVILIARQFLQRFAREDGKSFRAFTAEAEEALLAYSWPGNVRQLQNVIRSVVVLNEGELVRREMLPPLAAALPSATAAGFNAGPSIEPRPAAAAPVAPAAISERAIKPLDAVIRETIEFAIARCGGSIPKAAAALTVSPSTLYRRIQSWEAEGAGG
jgi:two-component system repressor protein LuxO